jgi:uncharacterized protein
MFAERVTFPSGSLRLQGVLNYQEEKACQKALILFSPHPKLGGDMDNNVIKGIGENLARAGFVTFRFNYRGVGRSQRSTPEVSLHDFWDTLDKSNDYQEIVQEGFAAVRYAKGLAGVKKVFMAGYSFGTRIMEEIAAGTETEGLVAISLPLRFHDFSKFANLSAKKLLIWGEKDFTASGAAIEAFVKTVRPPKEIAIIKDQDHFFRGYERDLSKLIEDILKND